MSSLLLKIFFFFEKDENQWIYNFFFFNKSLEFFSQKIRFFSELFEDKKFESLVLKVRKLHFFSPTTKFLSLVKRNFFIDIGLYFV
jgi:hypothetical protein